MFRKISSTVSLIADLTPGIALVAFGLAIVVAGIAGTTIY